MANGNILMNQLRGNLGGARFAVRKGKQIVSARPSAVQQRNSVSQVQQRVKLPPLVSFYRAAEKNFFKFAFQRKNRALTDYQEFVRLNMKRSPYLTKQLNERYDVFPAPYVMSSGSLNLPFAFVEQGVAYEAGRMFSSFCDGAFLRSGFPLSDGFAGCFLNWDEYDYEQDYTIGSVSDVLMSYFDLRRGDKLTFVSIVSKPAPVEASRVALLDRYIGVWDFASMIIDPKDETIIPWNNSGSLVYGRVSIAAQQHGSSTCLCLGVASSAVDANGAPYSSGAMCAIILTRYSGSSILCSNSFLHLPVADATELGSMMGMFEHARTDDAMAAAVSSYNAERIILAPGSSS